MCVWVIPPNAISLYLSVDLGLGRSVAVPFCVDVILCVLYVV